MGGVSVRVRVRIRVRVRTLHPFRFVSLLKWFTLTLRGKWDTQFFVIGSAYPEPNRGQSGPKHIH